MNAETHPLTIAEFTSYPQYSKDHFGYRLVRLDFAGRLESERASLLARIGELEGAIEWALGMRGEFPQRKEGEGAYWWRTELRRRALNQPTP